MLTWLGHSTFLLRTPGGKTVLIDPWVMGNPACPASLKRPERVDLMLATHGHFDHIGDAVELGKRLRPKTVGIFEICHWLNGKGVPNTVPMNKGGTIEAEGLSITMVHADHSCGILDGDRILYGGEAVGYVIGLEDGTRLYHAGDTALFGDMKIIGELYQPEVALLPIGDVFTMGPREAAYAARLLGVRRVIPMHHGTFPLLSGTPAALREALREAKGVELVELKPGEEAPLR